MSLKCSQDGDTTKCYFHIMFYEGNKDSRYQNESTSGTLKIKNITTKDNVL